MTPMLSPPVSSQGKPRSASSTRSHVLGLNPPLSHHWTLGHVGQARLHHPWTPGLVTIAREPSDCPPPQPRAHGHPEVRCNPPAGEVTGWPPPPPPTPPF